MAQPQPDGSRLVIQMGSMGLTDCQYRYSIPEIKMLAIVWSQKITIFMDHKPLESMGEKETTDIENPRLQNFFKKICHLNYDIQFLKGSENTAADDSAE